MQLAAFCEIIHNGSLIVDDIEDNSSIRRNKPCIHKLFGLDVSINAGNYMYYAPMMAILNSQEYSPELKNKITRIYFE
jgi:geranylgeranyl pyrophosphate synthase